MLLSPSGWGRALERARAMSPAEIVEEVRRSGLRGRGGAGFPAGVKWAAVAGHACETRFVVCNAAEGEPGTFKDRWLLRKNPHAVIEGALVAARAVGARAVYFATKASFEKELASLRAALTEMGRAGALAGIDVTIVEGPDDYLYGEEKALLNVIEGEGAYPRDATRPPYEVGLFARPGSPNPALVNNAETLAHAQTIVQDGPDAFRARGTADTPGTILFTISGDVVRPGVYELDAGVPLREAIFGAAGGPRPGRAVKAVLSGVSNAAIVPAMLDTPADFGSLARAGSGLGSAGFVVYDDTRNMARVARGIARFLHRESCDQCHACKKGLMLASAALDDDDPERAAIAARHAPQANRCYLPVQGAVLIPSLIERFREDFEAPLPGSDPPPQLLDFDEDARAFLVKS